MVSRTVRRERTLKQNTDAGTKSRGLSLAARSVGADPWEPEPGRDLRGVLPLGQKAATLSIPETPTGTLVRGPEYIYIYIVIE